MSETSTVFAQLMAVIAERKRNPPPKSYTTSLMQGGVERIGFKVMEEAAEVVRAAGQCDGSAEARAQFVHEAGDLVYHLFVLLGFRDVPLTELETEIARRFGRSGLDEKASRKENH